MFTGIIEEIGKISSIKPIAGGIRIKISTSKILDDISVNDSVCVSGVCLTAIKVEDDGFWVDAVGATLDKTTFAKMQLSTPVNLERSLKLNDRLGGHFVQGHANGIGTILEIKKLGENYFLKIEVDESLQKYLVEEGSITIDGISLTIAELDISKVGISIIPHTWKNTAIQFKKVGDKVNVETDVLAKYIEKLLGKNGTEHTTNITENWLKELGY
ncbi:MAG: riboflavin synthase [Ignavibacteria bacterium]|nr:riboflavin synthase [Ignavibacteria bacterium]